MGIFSAINESSINTLAYLDNVTLDECYESNLEEAALRMVAETETNYNMMMKAIGISELAFFEENGHEIVYEGFDVSSIMNKVRDFFEKVWKKIQELFARFISLVNSFTMDNKSFIKKYSSEIKAKWAKIKDFDFKGYKFNIPAEALVMEPKGDNVDLSIDLEKVTKARVDEIKELNKNYDDEVAKNCYGGETSLSDFRTKLIEQVHSGESSKSTLNKSDISIDEVINEVSTGSVAIKDAKKMQDSNKKFFGKVIANAKKLETKSAKIDQKNLAEDVTVSDVTSVASFMVRCSRTAAEAMQAADGIILQACKDRVKQSKAICTKILTSGTPKDESADFTHYTEGTSFLDGVVFK